MAFANEGTVMTVEGPVEPDALGITLTHEHLLVDLSVYSAEPRTPQQHEHAGKPLTIEALGEVRREPGIVADNLVLDDFDVTAEEVSSFKEAGGTTVVDVSPVGIRGDVERIRELGRRTGLTMLVCSGYYVWPTLPPDVAEHSVESLTELFLREVEEGLDGGGIRPGVLGEIGVSQPPHPEEWKVLTAAARAQTQTGLPLYIHPYFGQNTRIAPDIVRHVLDQGVDPARVDICHMDGYMNLEYQRRVADMGVYISFDTFGLEVYYDSLAFNHNCHDSQRERHILELLELGYAKQILISQDVCMKLQLRRYGGYGYGHLLNHIVPSLVHKGVDQATIDLLLVENPRRFLTIG